MVDIEALARDPSHRSLLLDRAMRTHDMDNERFLRKVRERLDRCLFCIHQVWFGLGLGLRLGLAVGYRLGFGYPYL